MAFHFFWGSIKEEAVHRSREPRPNTVLRSIFAQVLPSLKKMCDIAEEFYPDTESEMEQRKLMVIEKMEEKKMSVAAVAQAISFDPIILGLYLVKDAYPVPKRILEKVEGALAS